MGEPNVRRGYKWVDRELARMDPDTDWECMISLYVGHRVPEFALAMMVYPGTMRMMQPGFGAATLAHTAKLEKRPRRRFEDGNEFLMAWMVDGLSSTAGLAAAERLNRIHLAIARATPGFPATSTTSTTSSIPWSCWPRSPTGFRPRWDCPVRAGA